MKLGTWIRTEQKNTNQILFRYSIRKFLKIAKTKFKKVRWTAQLIYGNGCASTICAPTRAEVCARKCWISAISARRRWKCTSSATDFWNQRGRWKLHFSKIAPTLFFARILNTNPNAYFILELISLRSEGSKLSKLLLSDRLKNSWNFILFEATDQFLSKVDEEATP